MRSDPTNTTPSTATRKPAGKPSNRKKTRHCHKAEEIAWVAADAGDSADARRYVRGGVLAARAADDAPLAANILSTLSYQTANRDCNLNGVTPETGETPDD
jgi:hypothetical protein